VWNEPFLPLGFLLVVHPEPALSTEQCL
jgi:hypothetical protein